MTASASGAHQDVPPGRKVALSVGGLLLLAASLRLWGLGAESAWIDEAYSIQLARLPLGAIIQGSAADQHPPLYTLLLHFWLSFGGGVIAARLFSALLGVVLVGQTIWLGWNLAGLRLGLLAGLLTAISPTLNWYSQEARMYMLLAVWLLGATQVLLRLLSLPPTASYVKGLWAVYVGLCAAAIYTQYFAVFALTAHAFLVLLAARTDRRPRLLLTWALAMLAVGLLFLPWLPILLRQMSGHDASWIAPLTLGEIRDVPLRLLLGPLITVLPAAARWLAAVALAAFFIWATIRVRLHSDLRPCYLRLSLMCLIPWLGAAMLGTVVSLFQFKQFVWLAAPLLTLTVWSLLHLPRPATVLGLALLVLGAGASQTYQMVTLTKDDWRGAAAYLEMQLQPQDRLYANPAASHLALDLYTSQPLPLSGYPPAYHIVTGGWDGERLTPALAAAQLAPLATQAQRVWLIEFYPEFWDPQAALSQWLAAHGRLADDQWFGQVHLRRYDLEPTP